jgi:hypothetical protein
VNQAKDLIVAGGDTLDSSIHRQAGTTPIIVAYSITTTKIFWAIGLTKFS